MLEIFYVSTQQEIAAGKPYTYQSNCPKENRIFPTLLQSYVKSITKN